MCCFVQINIDKTKKQNKHQKKKKKYVSSSSSKNCYVQHIFFFTPSFSYFHHIVTALSQHSDYMWKFVVYLHLFPISDNMGGIAAASLMCIEDGRSWGHVEGLKSTGAFDTLKICSWWSLKKAKIGNLYQRFSHFVITVRLAVPVPSLTHDFITCCTLLLTFWYQIIISPTVHIVTCYHETQIKLGQKFWFIGLYDENAESVSGIHVLKCHKLAAYGTVPWSPYITVCETKGVLRNQNLRFILLPMVGLLCNPPDCL